VEHINGRRLHKPVQSTPLCDLKIVAFLKLDAGSVVPECAPTPPASWIAGLKDGASLAIAVDTLTFTVAVVALMLVHIPSPI